MINNGQLREKQEQSQQQQSQVTGLNVLSMAEVIAIRLYTGPGYVPLNKFLREVAMVGVDWRWKLAHSHTLTYSSTVLQLTNGLRKLVRTTQNFSTVYRAIRGELPESFWLHDDFGFVTVSA